MQLSQPSDYIIGTGKLHSVEELVEMAFRKVDLNWKNHVESSLKFLDLQKLHLAVQIFQKQKKIFNLV